MESAIFTKFLATTLIFIGLAMVAGYGGQTVGVPTKPKGTGGAILLGLGALGAILLCVGGVVLGQNVAQNTGGWVGLIVGMALAGIFIPWLLAKMVKGQSRKFFIGFWFGLCVLSIYSYLLGDWFGLWFVTPVTLIAFWYIMHRLSAYILPIHEKLDEEKNQKHIERLHSQAFRCLLTFTMGTNYPYYFVQDGKAEMRVKGDPFRQFFAGPGITYVAADHSAYVTNSVSITGVFGPGLHFTGLYGMAPRALDLRPQLRAFNVEALTSDGVPIRVLVFFPFQLRRGKQGNASPKVEFGKSFPFRQRTVFYVAAEELSDRARRKEQSKGRKKWDGELVPAIVTPIVQDIIGGYSVDELCAPLDPNRDPRVEIGKEMSKRVSKALWPHGIELVGGGLSNLVPQDQSVMQRRIDNWKTQWEHRILLMMSESRAERTRQLEQARVEAEMQIVARFSQVAVASTTCDDATQAAIALRFIDSLGEMVSESKNQWPIPKSYRDTLKQLRGEVEERQR